MKKWIVIIVILALVVSGLVSFFTSGKAEAPGTTAEEKQETVGTIKVPDGPKIKVVFNGPPEIEASWEKLGMESFQLHIVGTLRNTSNQEIKFTDVEFFLDGTQVGYLWPPSSEGWVLKPGEEAKVMKGLTGFSENTKVLEVKIEGFQKISSQAATAAVPTATPTPSVVKPDSTDETEVQGIAGTWHTLMATGKFSEVVKLYSPEMQTKLMTPGRKTLEEAWKERPVIRMEFERIEKSGSERLSVYVIVDYADGTTDDRKDFTFSKINNEWKIIERIVGEGEIK